MSYGAFSQPQVAISRLKMAHPMHIFKISQNCQYDKNNITQEPLNQIWWLFYQNSWFLIWQGANKVIKIRVVACSMSFSNTLGSHIFRGKFYEAMTKNWFWLKMLIFSHIFQKLEKNTKNIKPFFAQNKSNVSETQWK